MISSGVTTGTPAKLPFGAGVYFTGWQTMRIQRQMYQLEQKQQQQHLVQQVALLTFYRNHLQQEPISYMLPFM